VERGLGQRNDSIRRPKDFGGDAQDGFRYQGIVSEVEVEDVSLAQKALARSQLLEDAAVPF